MHTVVGTPYYVAPEVLRGEYDKQCDVWSLGIILYVFLCGYPPFEGDNNKEIFKNVLKSKLEFDPADWNTVSEEAKDLVRKMLSKTPGDRISAQDCLEHEWFKLNHDEEQADINKRAILKKMAKFRLPKKLQIETMKFLVNAVSTQGFDFNQLRAAFRALDIDNSGTLEISEIRQAFADMNMTEAQMDEIFSEIDLNHDGEINYTEFLAVTVDRRQAITKGNLEFAFHHFDVNNSGYITSDNLEECFRREGKHLTEEEVNEMLAQIKTKEEGKVSFEEFVAFISEMLNDSNSPTIFRGMSAED